MKPGNFLMAQRNDWKEKRVVVAGGTSGLGLHLVLAAAAQGAKIVILGRDRERLEQACQKAIAAGAQEAIGFSIDLRTISVPCDQPIDSLCDDVRLQAFLETNEVDLLINAVGRSDRGPISSVSAADLRSLLEDNLVCTWQSIRLFKQSLIRARGTIVNIGSLAGLVSAPNLGGYNAAKSALTAMSRQLRLEWKQEKVHVMLVCTGPIAREDSGRRYEQLAKDRGLEIADANVPGGAAKLKLLEPVGLANRILRDASTKRCEVVIPTKAKWLAAITALWPALGDWILVKFLKR
jgi:short-subunit dehydrogenase